MWIGDILLARTLKLRRTQNEFLARVASHYLSGEKPDYIAAYLRRKSRDA